MYKESNYVRGIVLIWDVLADPYFDFKQFRVEHDCSSMKVGTDSVVLGCLVNLVGTEQHILDIGTGCGLLALMMAQRSNALIDAVEIDEQSVNQALGNFKSSPWQDRLTVYLKRIQDFKSPVGYDFILSNPPYFGAASNFRIDQPTRRTARHNSQLTQQELCISVNRLLKDTGSFWMILPVEEALSFEILAGSMNLYLNQELLVHSRAGFPVIRKVQEYRRSTKNKVTSDLILYDDTGNRSDQYKQLSKEFYL